MISNFEETKKQLAELAEVINGYKSEAVQLRLIEIIFSVGGGEDHEVSDQENDSDQEKKPPPKRRRKAKAKSKAVGSTEKSGKKPAASGTGPQATLQKIFEADFFAEERLIGDICKHAKDDYAKTIKPNDISGKLARMVRNNELSRRKDGNGQYVYKNHQ